MVSFVRFTKISGGVTIPHSPSWSLCWGEQPGAGTKADSSDDGTGQSPEINPRVHGQLILHKGAKDTQGGWIVSTLNETGKKSNICVLRTFILNQI